MKVVLTQPNYAWFGKRAWEMPPYTLAILNACLGDKYDVELFDPNFANLSEESVSDFFKLKRPDVVGISSISTEYVEASRRMSKLVKEASPESTIIQGGVLPTVAPELAVDENVDYWMMGEGEFRLPKFLEALRRKCSWPILDRQKDFIDDLDSVPLPDYGNLNLRAYGNKKLKYSNGLLARRFPFAVTVTSRGCPYHCIFCAAATTSGRKVRFRSPKNVLAEINQLYADGFREIIFLDDHFLGSRRRAINIIQGLAEKKDLLWKCVNMTIFSLDEELMRLMKKSGCYQITLSVESGSQSVLDTIIRKPVRLNKIADIVKTARSLGFELLANFVIGFPGETWQQIRQTFRFAEDLDVDLVRFHIATPLPKTELMQICLDGGYLLKDGGCGTGYTSGLIITDEFSPFELEVLRAFEWDRINFSSPERCQTIARIEGISMQELEKWRVDTRRKSGINVVS